MNTDPVAAFKRARSKLIILDYDGTLVDFNSVPENTEPGERVITLLKSLLGEEETRLIISTGRSAAAIDKLLPLTGLEIIAEHGSAIRKDGTWTDRITEDITWKQKVLPLLEDITGKCPGSFIEDKRFSLSWHYRHANVLQGYMASRDIVRQIAETLDEYNLKLLDGNKVIEVVPQSSGKGYALKACMAESNYDYILCIGDDITDEHMFEQLQQMHHAISIKVGEGNTLAKQRLDRVEEVLHLLECLCD